MATKTDNTGEPTGAPMLPSKQTKASAAEPTVQTEVATTPADDVVVKPVKLDTPESDAAIDDIVAKEADEVLAAQDAGVAVAETEADNQATEPEKHGHPIFWFIIALLTIAALVTLYVLMNPGLELPFSA